MAKLMKCGDCGSQISRSAKRCPNCGKKITPRYVWIFGGMFAFIVFWTIISSNSDNVSNQQAQEPATTNVQNQAFEEHKAKRMAEIEADPNYKKTQDMAYAVCLEYQKVTGEAMKGATAVPISSNEQSSVVKYCTYDGAVTVTCDGKNNKMTIAESNRDGC